MSNKTRSDAFKASFSFHANSTVPYMEVKINMVTFLIILTILIVVALIIGIVLMVLLATAGAFGGLFVFLFGDIIIGIALTVLLIRGITKRK